MTREAFEVYRRHLAPGGIIAVHISNTYLRLGPVVQRLAENCGMKAALIEGDKNDDRRMYGNSWMLVTNNEGFLAAHIRPPRPTTTSCRFGPINTAICIKSFVKR